jgi:hypothetical protein
MVFKRCNTALTLTQAKVGAQRTNVKRAHIYATPFESMRCARRHIIFFAILLHSRSNFSVVPVLSKTFPERDQSRQQNVLTKVDTFKNNR